MFLTPLEVKLFREQFLVRAPGTPLVFPTPTRATPARKRFVAVGDERGVASAAPSQ